MTAHKIFDGAFVMYSDMHLKECTSYFQSSTDSSLLYIDHCREGRIESEISNHAYSYLQEHEMRVDDRRYHSGRFCFPPVSYTHLFPAGLCVLTQALLAAFLRK